MRKTTPKTINKNERVGGEINVFLFVFHVNIILTKNNVSRVG